MKQAWPLQLSVFVLGALCFITSPAAAQEVTDEAIDRAIERMQEYFWSEQQPDGGWDSGANFHRPEFHDGGESPMVAYAMLVSGVPPQDPRMQRALQHLQELELNGTYPIGIRAHIWAALPLEQYGGDLTRDAYWLLEAHRESIFDYGPRRVNRFDNSTTQYGLLGLWEVAKRGGDVPVSVWQDAARHFIDTQNADGGWGYSPGRESRGSMTAAGMTVLYVVLQELYRDARQPPQPIVESINRGIAWFDQNFQHGGNINGGHNYYYWYGVERIAIAGGLKSFNGLDWFRTGASYILGNVGNNGRIGGGSYEDTAFALAFLARGRFPVWINKIRIDGIDWNQYPNDIYFLNNYISGLREHELNWQVIDLGLPAEEWISGPIAWLSSGDEFELDEQQLANLRRYIDLGGLVVFDPVGSSSGFRSSVQDLAQQLYPDLSFEPIPDGHPIAQGLVQAGANRRIEHLSNGVRTLMILTPGNWGYTFQSDTRPGRSPEWQSITNIYAYATGRGRLTHRLDDPIPPRDADRRASGDQVHVARIYTDSVGIAEPLMMTPAANLLYNQTGHEVFVHAQHIDDLGDPLRLADGEPIAPGDELSEDAEITTVMPDLVYLAGNAPIELTESQILNFTNYTDAGGTILIETLSGQPHVSGSTRTDFSADIERQLVNAYGGVSGPLSSSSAILTGRGIDGAERIDRVVYRPLTIINSRPRGVLLSAMVDRDDNNRPVVLYSSLDIGLGNLGLRHMNINGYATPTARQLMINLLLHAAEQDVEQDPA
jgi:hypothetical protein